jgi:hypothetical protein
MKALQASLDQLPEMSAPMSRRGSPKKGLSTPKGKKRGGLVKFKRSAKLVANTNKITGKCWGHLRFMSDISSLGITDARVDLTVDKFQIGRGRRSNLTLKHKLLSGVHCEVTKKPDPDNADGHIIWLTDLSTNGVFVEGKKLGKKNGCELLSGQQFSLMLTDPIILTITHDYKKENPLAEDSSAAPSPTRPLLGSPLSINAQSGGDDFADDEQEQQRFSPVYVEEPPTPVAVSNRKPRNSLAIAIELDATLINDLGSLGGIAEESEEEVEN